LAVVRGVVYRFENLETLRSALGTAERELALEGPERVADGEWVLATFEIGSGKWATASAARGAMREGKHFVCFEARDWERLLEFADGGSGPGLPQRTLVDVEEAGPATIPIQSDAMAIPLVNPPKTTERYPVFGAANDAPAVSNRSDLMGPDTLRPPAPAPGPQHAPTFPQGAHVLVVDDDPAIGDMVSAMLEAVGLTVENTTSAEDALRLVEETHFDLVVLDWSLPGMSGLELCRSIRHRASTATLPLLFLSAHSSTTDIVDAFASGADDFVVKPFRAPELGARIFALLRRARMSGA
jgi:two-component system phosphate regulon response regulator PhoB